MPSSPISPAEIIGLANNQLKRAAVGYRKSRRLQIVTLVLGLASIFIGNSYAYIPALMAFCVQIYAWIVRNQAAQSHSLGEEGRTRGLLLDAIGSTGERVDLSNWYSRASPKAGEAVPPAGADYFASISPVGLRRLCDHIQENAFWGKHQFKAAAAFYSRYLWCSAAAVVVSVLISVPITSDGQGLIFARVLVAAMASGAALTQLGEVMSWKSAETRSDLLDRRLEVLSGIPEGKLRSVQIGSVFSAYGDYCIATAAAPPVPEFIYKRERDRLNILWEKHSNA